MESRNIWMKGWRGVVLILVGVVMGANLIAPAVAHVAGWTHNWKVHIRPKADARYLRKGEIHISHNGQVSINPFGLDPATIQDATNETQIMAEGTNQTWIQLHLVGPARIGRFNYGLKSLRVCYDDAAGDIITGTAIYDHNNNLTTTVVEDATDRTSATPACYSVAPTGPYAPVGSLVLVLKWDTVTVGDTLGIHGIKGTWTPVGTAPTAPLKTSSGGKGTSN
jgi:hypothetical protein